MKPGSLPICLSSRPVCQLCHFILRQPTNRRAFLTVPTLKTPSIRRQIARPRTPVRSVSTTSSYLQDIEDRDAQELKVLGKGYVSLSESIATLTARFDQAIAEIKAIYDSPKIEKENVILHVLDELEHVARQAIAIRARQPLPAKAPIRQSSAGAILSGLGGEEKVESTNRKTKPKPLGLDALPSPAFISQLAEQLIKHEKVFISPNVLGLYIHLQRLLANPLAIPEALYLYAHKPVPLGLPSTIAAIMPLAIYMIAQELSVYSNFIDPFLFKMYAFAGISTYVLCTGTLGFVALTTHNDHHDRVVWRPGMPLYDRYIREDERAALDRIALAWGFKETWRRGDEEGDDWEGLRQWILLQGMILDKPDLMHGMNPGR
ncbi:hypothetical protein GQ44DRAFT_703613 [Phaeosphaeriaceae sp. PMI808]|nr:hypothetical protein GQ44DRAFT_703613 [Phaeosphaeriaceae sp. PMI808]